MVSFTIFVGLGDFLSIEMINKIAPGAIVLQQIGFLVFLFLVIGAVISFIVGSSIPFMVAFGIFGLFLIYAFADMLHDS